MATINSDQDPVAAPSRVSILVDADRRASDSIGRLSFEDLSAPTVAGGADEVLSPGPTAIIADEGDLSNHPLTTTTSQSEGGLATNNNTLTGDDAANFDDTVSQDDEDMVDNDIVHDEEEDDDDDDVSDYSYAYDDDDEGQYSGFLIPEPPVAVIPEDYVAPADSAASAAGPSSTLETTTGSRCVSSTAPISGDQPSSSITPLTKPKEEGRKQRWREPTRAAVNMSLRAEKEKTGSGRRLASDLYKIMMADTQEAGFSLEPCDEDAMDKWCIKLFGFDEDSNLAKDLLVCGMDHVELEMSFPEQYPFEPPFVRVVKPRFKRQTGFVMSGALCMELLTKDGWNPINDIESVIVSIRSLMVVGDGRLQAAADMAEADYARILKVALEKTKSQVLNGKGDDMTNDEEAEGDANAGEAKRKRAPSDSVIPRKATGGSYSTAEAQSAYDHLSKYHKQEGWDKSGYWARRG
jgi:ubiquitin-conjugating enzyme E2 Q